MKCIIRNILLFVEVLVLALVVMGGSHVIEKSSEESAAVNEEKSSEAEKVPAETPEFRWEDYRMVAHALGGLEDKTYLNSKEAFIASYEKGIRLFEVDLCQTSDGVWVCRHSWNQPLGQWKEEGKKVLSEEEFLSAPIYGKYTPMTFQDLLILLKDYPDAFVMLDSKQYSIRNYRRTLEDYIEYIQLADEAGAKEVLDQLIPEIYNEAMFPGTALMYRFPSYIYSLWQEYSVEELRETAAFCAEKNIPAVTVYYKYWSEEIQEIFDEKGILVYIYTVNDLQEAKKFISQGAMGICSDTLTDKDIKED